MIEELLQKPYWVIDFLPRQVPQGCAGQFFAVERFYLQGPRQAELRRRLAQMLLQVNCYFDIQVCTPEEEKWIANPAPERLFDWIGENAEDWCVLLPAEKTLFTLDREDTCMTVYNPSEELLRLLGQLAIGTGLYLWQPDGGRR